MSTLSKRTPQSKTLLDPTSIMYDLTFARASTWTPHAVENYLDQHITWVMKMAMFCNRLLHSHQRLGTMNWRFAFV